MKKINLTDLLAKDNFYFLKSLILLGWPEVGCLYPYKFLSIVDLMAGFASAKC